MTKQTTQKQSKWQFKANSKSKNAYFIKISLKKIKQTKKTKKNKQKRKTKQTITTRNKRRQDPYKSPNQITK